MKYEIMNKKRTAEDFQNHGKGFYRLSSEYPQAKILRSLLLVLLLFCFMVITSLTMAYAGKHPYPELNDQIVDGVVNILIKHGMPVRGDRENPWYKCSYGPNKYSLYFYQSNEIPQQAIVEVVGYIMDLYEKNGRKDRFSILMYREPFKPRLRLISDGKVFFKLIIEPKGE